MFIRALFLITIWLLGGCAVNSEPPLSVQPQVRTEQWAQKWWMPRHNEKLVQKARMSRVDLVFLGDSITHAFDNKGRDVWQQFYAPRNAINLGFSGDRTENVLWRIQNGAVDGIAPKLLVLMIGTNNTGHRQDPPQETALGIKTILDELEQRLPNTKILLLAIFPRGETPDNPLRQLNQRTNQIIQSFDDGKRVFYLDINSIFLQPNGHLSRTVMKDLLHPNKAQYRFWAEAIEPHIETHMD